MIRWVVVAFVALTAGRALAQPAQDPQQLPAATITEDDRMWARRELIDDDQHVFGALGGLVVGFGLGHAIQCRWTERGWMFTVGDSAAIATMMIGLGNMSGCWGLMQGGGTKCKAAGVAAYGGLISLGILHVWQGLDSMSVPQGYNRRILKARAKLRFEGPYLAPPPDGDGATAGLVLSF